MPKASKNLAHKRRLTLKTLSGSALLGGVMDRLPGQWLRPSIHTAVLPAHAQVSPGPAMLILRIEQGGQEQTRLNIPYEVTMTDGEALGIVIPPANTQTASLHRLIPAAHAQGALPGDLRLDNDEEIIIPVNTTRSIPLTDGQGGRCDYPLHVIEGETPGQVRIIGGPPNPSAGIACGQMTIYPGRDNQDNGFINGFNVDDPAPIPGVVSGAATAPPPPSPPANPAFTVGLAQTPNSIREGESLEVGLAVDPWLLNPENDDVQSTIIVRVAVGGDGVEAEDFELMEDEANGITASNFDGQFVVQVEVGYSAEAQTFNFTLNISTDEAIEGTERLRLSLLGDADFNDRNNYAVDPAAAVRMVSIGDETQAPVFSISGTPEVFFGNTQYTPRAEGMRFTLHVHRNNGLSDITVNLNLHESSTATAMEDFRFVRPLRPGVSGDETNGLQILLTPPISIAEIEVEVVSDSIEEGAETLTFELSQGFGPAVSFIRENPITINLLMDIAAPIEVQFTSETYTIAEPGAGITDEPTTRIQLEVERIRDQTEAIVVRIDRAGGNANAADYAIDLGPEFRQVGDQILLTVPAGDQSGVPVPFGFEVRARSDRDTDEGVETVIWSIAENDSEYQRGDRRETTLTITHPPVARIMSIEVLDEAADSNLTRTLSELDINNATTQTIRINLQVAHSQGETDIHFTLGGTATRLADGVTTPQGYDYAVEDATLVSGTTDTFAITATNGTAQLTLTQLDSFTPHNEGQETIEITLLERADTYQLDTARRTATLTIDNTPFIELSFGGFDGDNRLQVSEGASDTFTIRADAQSSADITFGLDFIRQGSETLDPPDFSLEVGNNTIARQVLTNGYRFTGLTIPSGQTELTVTVTATSDFVRDEQPNENFNITLHNPTTQGESQITQAPGERILRIVNVPPAVEVQFAADTYFVEEGDTETISLTATRRRATTAPIEVTITRGSNSTAALGDYSVSTGNKQTFTLTVPAGSAGTTEALSFMVTATEDTDFNESSETIIWNIATSTADTPDTAYSIGTQRQTELTITHPPVARISQIRVLDKAQSNALTDTISELNIRDAGTKNIQFFIAVTNLPQGGSANIRFSLGGSATNRNRDQSVTEYDYDLAAGPTLVTGTTDNYEVTATATGNNTTAEVGITLDSLENFPPHDENDENIIVTLVDNASTYQINTTSNTATITITNSPIITLSLDGFTNNVLELEEGDSSTITVRADSIPSANINFGLDFTRQGSATLNPADFSLSVGTRQVLNDRYRFTGLTIPTGQDTLAINITTISDIEFSESDETFVVTLHNPSIQNGNITQASGQRSLRITNVPASLDVQFALAEYSVREGEQRTINVTINRVRAHSDNILIHIGRDGGTAGTATSGEYTVTGSSVTFTASSEQIVLTVPAGSAGTNTTLGFTVAATTDSEFGENSETIIWSIVNSTGTTPQTSYSTGNQDRTTLTITQPPVARISQMRVLGKGRTTNLTDTISEMEIRDTSGRDDIRVWVQVDNLPSSGTDIYFTLGGSATQRDTSADQSQTGYDFDVYTAPAHIEASGNRYKLNFPDGDNEQFFDLNELTAFAPHNETNETIIITLDNSQSGDNYQIDPARSTATINLTNTPIIGLTLPGGDLTLAEGGDGTITVMADGASSSAITFGLDFILQGSGTRTPPDFTLSAGSLTITRQDQGDNGHRFTGFMIPANQDSLNVSIDVQADSTTTEGDEVFIISIHDPRTQNGEVTSTATRTLTILDRLPAVDVQFAAASYSVREGDSETISVSVTRRRNHSDITALIGRDNSSAALVDDYSASGTGVNFNATSGQIMLTIPAGNANANTTLEFSVMAIADTEFNEGNENLVLSFASISGDPDDIYSIGDQSSTTLTINPAPVVRIESLQVLGQNADTNLTRTISESAINTAANKTIRVNLSVANLSGSTTIHFTLTGSADNYDASHLTAVDGVADTYQITATGGAANFTLNNLDALDTDNAAQDDNLIITLIDNAQSYQIDTARNPATITFTDTIFLSLVDAATPLTIAEGATGDFIVRASSAHPTEIVGFSLQFQRESGNPTFDTPPDFALEVGGNAITGGITGSGNNQAYEFINAALQIPTAQTDRTITVRASRDTQTEESESFRIVIRPNSVSPDDSVAMIGEARLLTITNVLPTVQFDRTTLSVSEPTDNHKTSTSQIITLTSDPENAFGAIGDVYFTVTPSGATEGARDDGENANPKPDYTIDSNTATRVGNSNQYYVRNSATFTLQVHGDFADSENETLTFNLVDRDNYNLGSDSELVVTLTDVGLQTIGWAQTEIRISEPAAGAWGNNERTYQDILITRTGNGPPSIVVFSISDGEGVMPAPTGNRHRTRASGVDLHIDHAQDRNTSGNGLQTGGKTPSGRNLDNQTQGIYALQTNSHGFGMYVYRDNNFEGEERVTLTLLDEPEYHVDPQKSVLTVIIEDSPPIPTVQFSTSTLEVEEPFTGNTPQTITLNISPTATADQLGNIYFTVGSTSTATDADYTLTGVEASTRNNAQQGEYQLTTGNTFTININTDLIGTEGDETVVLTLVDTDTYDLGSDSTLTITITDSRRTPSPFELDVVIEFAAPTYTATEGETTDVVIRRATGSGMSQVTINRIFTTPTGIDNDDFNVDKTNLNENATFDIRGFENIQIPRGESSIKIPIEWLVDADADTQSLQLQLNSSNITAQDSGINATTSGTTSTTITVTQAKPTVGFTASTAQITEGGSHSILFQIEDFQAAQGGRVGFVMRSTSNTTAALTNFSIQTGNGVINASEDNGTYRVDAVFESTDALQAVLETTDDYAASEDKTIEFTIDTAETHTFTEGNRTFRNSDIDVGTESTLTITIEDAGVPTIGFTESRLTIAEPVFSHPTTTVTSKTIAFDINPPAAAGQFGNVYFTITGNSGATDADYSVTGAEASTRQGALANEYQITGGDSFALGILPDVLGEGNETLTLTLVDADNYNLAGNSTLTIDITDQGAPVVEFVESSLTIREPATGTATETINLNITPADAAGQFGEIHFTVTEAPGVTADDYSLGGVTQVGSTNEYMLSGSSFSISVNADTIAPEDGETLTFQLLSRNNYQLGASATQTLQVTIEDSGLTPPVVIEFASGTYAGEEGGTTSVIIRRTADSGPDAVTISQVAMSVTGMDENDFTISFSNLTGSPTQNGVTAIQNLEIPEGESSITIPITWVQDDDSNEDQSMTLTLDSANISIVDSKGATTAGITSTTITVSQTALPRQTIGWGATTYSFEEPAAGSRSPSSAAGEFATQTITITRAEPDQGNATAKPVQFEVALGQGITSGPDLTQYSETADVVFTGTGLTYDSANDYYVLDANISQFTVQVYRDNLQESNETITLTLRDGGTEYTVDQNNRETTLTLTDNPPQTVGWTLGTLSVAEPAAGARSGRDATGEFSPLTVSLTRSGGTAQPVFFTADMSGDLTQYDATGHTTEVLLEGQGLTYSSTTSQYQLAPASSQFNLRLYRDNLADGNTTLTLTLVDGDNYLVSTRQVTISLVDSPPQTVGWQSGDATITEPTAGDRSTQAGQTGEFASQVITLDRGTSGTNQPVRFSVTRGEGVQPVSDTDLTQYSSTADVRFAGTGLSYVSADTYELAGNTTQFTVELYRDRETETDETLTLRLEDGSNYLVDDNNREITITLEDKAPQTIRWAQNTYRITEPYAGQRDNSAGSVVDQTITLTRSGGAGTDHPVLFDVSGTATVGSVFTDPGADVILVGPTPTANPPSTRYQLTSGNTFTLRLTRDPDKEPDETVILTLVAGPGYAIDTTNNNHITTITLVDNPPTTLPTTRVSFANATHDALEGGVVMVRVNKLGDSAITFGLMRSGTADDGDIASVTVNEQPAPQGGITIPAEADGVDIAITLAADTEIEGSETLTFTLDDLRPDAGHLAEVGNISETTITISNVTRIEFADVIDRDAPDPDNPGTLVTNTDTDAGILYAAAPEGTRVSIKVNRFGTAPVSFNVLRDDSSVDHLDVAMTTPTGSRVEGSEDDFDRTVSINEGTEAVLHLELKIDAETEGDETIIFDLDNPVADPEHNVGLGNITRLVITIQDRPGTLVEFMQTAYSGAEGTQVDIEVVRTSSEQPPAAITFDLGRPGGNSDAAGPADIEMVILPDGTTIPFTDPISDITINDTTTNTISLILARDAERESDETLTLKMKNLRSGTDGHKVALGAKKRTTITITNVEPTTTALLPLTFIEFATYSYVADSTITQTIENNTLTVNATEGDQVFILVDKTGGSAVEFDIIRQPTESTVVDLDIASYTQPDGGQAKDSGAPDQIGVTIDAGNTGTSYVITLKIDDENEDSETLVFELQNARGEDSGHRVGIGTVDRIVINIANVPVTFIEFSQAAYPAVEGQRVDLEVVRTGAQGQGVSGATFTLIRVGQLSSAGFDDIDSIALPDGSTQPLTGSITITLPASTNDSETDTIGLNIALELSGSESDEHIVFRLDQIRGATSGHGLAGGTNTDTRVNITHVPVTRIAFASATHEEAEGAFVNLRVVKTGTSAVTFDLALTYQNGASADDHGDFNLTGRTIAAGVGSINLTLPLVTDDFTPEAGETITVTLTNITGDAGHHAIAGSQDHTVVTIINVGPTTTTPTTTVTPTALIEFVATSPVNVNEGDTLRIEFRVTGATSRMTFDLQRVSGSSAIRTDLLNPVTGTLPGPDNLPPFSITELTAGNFHITGIQMNAATRSGSIYIMVNADSTAEGAETLIFEIANVRNPDDGRAVAAGANNQITINIADTSTDPVMIGWAQPQYRVTEPAAGPSNQSSTEQIISITRTPARAVDVKVAITTGPGVAVNPRGWSAYDDGVDFAITDQGFISQGQNAEFTLSGTDTAFTVRVYRDAEAEAEETVTFTLVEGDGYTFDTTNNNHITTLTLVDNPPITIPTPTATAAPTIAPPPRTTVAPTTAAPTTTAEPTTAGPTTTATPITGNAPRVEWARTAYTVNENAGATPGNAITIALNIRLPVGIPPLTHDILVTATGSAQAGGNYAAFNLGDEVLIVRADGGALQSPSGRPDQILIPAGDSSLTIQVFGNDTTEPDRTVILTLEPNTSSPRAYELGAPRQTTITITDNPVVQFGRGAYESMEGSAGFTILDITPPSNIPVFFTVSESAGIEWGQGRENLEAGDDIIFTGAIPDGAPALNRYRLEAGEPLRVFVLYDDVREPPETITLTLAEDSGYAIGGNRQTTITLLDNSAPTTPDPATIPTTQTIETFVEFADTSLRLSGNEGETVTLRINRTGPSAVRFDIAQVGSGAQGAIAAQDPNSGDPDVEVDIDINLLPGASGTVRGLTGLVISDITIFDNRDFVEVPINLLTDLVETDGSVETLRLQIQNLRASAGNAKAGANHQTVITIRNVLPPTTAAPTEAPTVPPTAPPTAPPTTMQAETRVEFAKTSYTGIESETVNLRINKTGPSAITFNIHQIGSGPGGPLDFVSGVDANLAHGQVEADVAADFTDLAGASGTIRPGQGLIISNLTIPAGSDYITLPINLLTDTLDDEGTETLRLELRAGEGEVDANRQTVITITNQPLRTFQWRQSVASYNLIGEFTTRNPIAIITHNHVLTHTYTARAVLADGTETDSYTIDLVASTLTKDGVTQQLTGNHRFRYDTASGQFAGVTIADLTVEQLTPFSNLNSEVQNLIISDFSTAEPVVAGLNQTQLRYVLLQNSVSHDHLPPLDPLVAAVLTDSFTLNVNSLSVNQLVDALSDNGISSISNKPLRITGEGQNVGQPNLYHESNNPEGIRLGQFREAVTNLLNTLITDAQLTEVLRTTLLNFLRVSSFVIDHLMINALTETQLISILQNGGATENHLPSLLEQVIANDFTIDETAINSLPNHQAARILAINGVRMINGNAVGLSTDSGGPNQPNPAITDAEYREAVRNMLNNQITNILRTTLLNFLNLEVVPNLAPLSLNDLTLTLPGSPARSVGLKGEPWVVYSSTGELFESHFGQGGPGGSIIIPSVPGALTTPPLVSPTTTGVPQTTPDRTTRAPIIITRVRFSPTEYSGREGDIITLRIEKDGPSEVTFALEQRGTGQGGAFLPGTDANLNSEGNSQADVQANIAGLTQIYNERGLTINGITIPAAAPFIEIPLQLLSDTRDEGTETLRLNIINATGPGLTGLGTNTAATITIVNVAAVTSPPTTLPPIAIGLQFAQSAYSGIEGDTIMVRIEKSTLNGAAQAITFDLAPVGSGVGGIFISGEANDFDINLALPQAVGTAELPVTELSITSHTISAESDYIDVPFNLLQDIENEEPETLRLELRNLRPASGVAIPGENLQTVITIRNRTVRTYTWRIDIAGYNFEGEFLTYSFADIITHNDVITHTYTATSANDNFTVDLVGGILTQNGRRQTLTSNHQFRYNAVIGQFSSVLAEDLSADQLTPFSNLSSEIQDLIISIPTVAEPLVSGLNQAQLRSVLQNNLVSHDFLPPLDPLVAEVLNDRFILDVEVLANDELVDVLLDNGISSINIPLDDGTTENKPLLIAEGANAGQRNLLHASDNPGGISRPQLINEVTAQLNTRITNAQLTEVLRATLLNFLSVSSFVVNHLMIDSLTETQLRTILQNSSATKNHLPSQMELVITNDFTINETAINNLTNVQAATLLARNGVSAVNGLVVTVISNNSASDANPAITVAQYREAVRDLVNNNIADILRTTLRNFLRFDVTPDLAPLALNDLTLNFPAGLNGLVGLRGIPWRVFSATGDSTDTGYVPVPPVPIVTNPIRTLRWTWEGGRYQATGQFTTRAAAAIITEQDVLTHTYQVTEQVRFEPDNFEIDLIGNDGAGGSGLLIKEVLIDEVPTRVQTPFSSNHQFTYDALAGFIGNTNLTLSLGNPAGGGSGRFVGLRNTNGTWTLFSSEGQATQGEDAPTVAGEITLVQFDQTQYTGAEGDTLTIRVNKGVSVTRQAVTFNLRQIGSGANGALIAGDATAADVRINNQPAGTGAISLTGLTIGIDESFIDIPLQLRVDSAPYVNLEGPESLVLEIQNLTSDSASSIGPNNRLRISIAADPTTPAPTTTREPTTPPPPFREFIFTWRIPDGGGQFFIPVTTLTSISDEDYNCYVDWGEEGFDPTGPHTRTTRTVDGTTYSVLNTGWFYLTGGDYQVKISGNFPAISVAEDLGFLPNDPDDPSKGTSRMFEISPYAENFISIDQWGDVAWKTMQDAFHGAVNLELNAQDAPDLSAVTSLLRMFQNSGITGRNTDFSQWDVSNVRNFVEMFRGSVNFNPPDFSQIVGWNFANISGGFSRLFRDTPALTTANYDAMLIRLSQFQFMPFQVSFIGFQVQYSSAAVAARAVLTGQNIFVSDNGLDEDYVPPAPPTTAGPTVPPPTLPPGVTLAPTTPAPTTTPGPTEPPVTTTPTPTTTPGPTTTSGPQGFVTEWVLNSGPERNVTLGIANINGYTYNFTVDWGDGSTPDTVTSNANPNHIYQSNGTYQITLTGNFGGLTRFAGNGPLARRIRRIVKWGTFEFRDLTQAFFGASNLEIAADAGAPIFSSSGVSCNGIFFRCSAFNSNLSHWDVSSVTNMLNMFNSTALSTANFNATLIGWSTQSVRPNIRLTSIPSSITLPPTDSAASAAYNTLISAPHNWDITKSN